MPSHGGAGMAQWSVRRDDAKKAREADLPSIIAVGLRIIGNVASDGVVHVEGQVDGDIQCEELTIGANGRVRGHVAAKTVHVLGAMTGAIRARTVLIADGATVSGEVIHEKLTVEHGAVVDGYYRPVERVEVSSGVDVRQRIGRTSKREATMPHRPLPPRRKGRRPTVALQPPDGDPPKPLH